MLKKIGIFLFVLLLTLTSAAIYVLYYPIDIRTASLLDGVEAADYKKGKALIAEMETAYGGKEQWKAYKEGVFVQSADWYGRKAISHWDTLPQRFVLRCELGTDNSELKLLNGPNTGVRWGVENGASYSIRPNQEKKAEEYNRYSDKLLFKSYWFQFPFRVGEAEFISYAGEAIVEGQAYDLVFATWGSEAANTTYDQFILYLNKETHLIDWLYFTVRDKTPAVPICAKFDNFKYVDKITLAHNQYVMQGKPGAKGIKLHENHYEVIHLGVSEAPF
jgi:hypothetical protein